MEIILLIVAAVVLFYFYNTLKEYLKNPLNPKTKTEEYDLKNDPYLLVQSSPLDKFKQTQTGAYMRLLKFLDIQKNALDNALRSLFINELEQPLNSEQQNLAKELLSEPVDKKENFESLCQEIADHTHGEYTKRLKLVEFLMLLAYADGILDSKEKELFLDVGAFLQIDNQDFNELYDHFERFNAIEIPMSLEEAKNLFEIPKETNATKQNLEEKALNLSTPYYHKMNDNKRYSEQDFISLKKIALASQLLENDLKDS
ncbi:tellurite resistance TerB family protein [Helicobacter pylori]|uniref:TerB family tellurite resistance protein n=1 Tax=Helicobacter pylori TaxID=210 RepID=UPI0007DB1186|nr:TerB family tellurite resistance protein [Helicobacter pylori]ANH40914.1 tellurite resistance TerB family protein [Helicobacter pylori]